MHGLTRTLLIAIALAPLASSAAAETLTPAVERPFSVQAGLGFAADPEGFLLGFEGDYRFHQDWSFAPRLRLAFDDDLTIVAPTANLRYWFDLSDAGGELSILSPFLQTGIGFSYIEKDDRRGDDDDSGFLVTVGGGLEVRLTDELSLTSTVEFNLHPSDVLNENFYFTWEIAALRVRF